jgi:rhodanese-related sulfurtransferase
MKPHISFGLKTAIIVGVSVGLALVFNATRPDRLPLVRDPQSAIQAAVQRGEISLADATLLFHSGQAVFVDAREAGEYAAGHIDGAISLDTVSFGQKYPAIKDRLEGATTVITYCDGKFCELSHELADQLRSLGLLDVRVLRNGWTLWRDQGLPTATGAEALPLAAQADNATAQDKDGSIPADMPQLNEPAQNMPTDAAPGEQDQTNQTLQAVPLQQPTPEAEPLPAALQKPAPLAPAPLEPAPLEPTTPESAPLEVESPEPRPENPAPLPPAPNQTPTEEPHETNQPASQTQGEHS